jgi:hypothetical protein
MIPTPAMNPKMMIAIQPWVVGSPPLVRRGVAATDR